MSTRCRWHAYPRQCKSRHGHAVGNLATSRNNATLHTKAAFLALIENKLWICSKARLSDDATDEEEVAEKDDVAEALDWDKVVEPNIAAVASAFDSVALFY